MLVSSSGLKAFLEYELLVIDEVRTSAETFLHALYSWLYPCHSGSGACSGRLTKKKKRKPPSFHNAVLVRPFCGVKFSFPVIWLKTSPHSVQLGSFSPV